MLREATGPVPQAALDAVWHEPVQRARALDGLVADGLVEPLEQRGVPPPGQPTGLTAANANPPGLLPVPEIRQGHRTRAQSTADSGIGDPFHAAHGPNPGKQ